MAPNFSHSTKITVMPDVKEKIIPPQQQGGKKDIEHKVETLDDDAARKLFSIARNRLLNVNEWHEISEGISATFQLVDQAGKEVNRTAELHDYFKINLPAPGPTEGKGFDWVQIEAIEDKSDSAGPYESIAIRVRPTANPQEKGEDVAHFFKDEATSSFIIERKGRNVLAAVYGRNEIPNNDTSNLIDKVRNALVGTTAIMGLSNVQWGNLVKGLLTT
jgi:hypothetical protein